ncbi:MAG: nucleotide exchange factor GrpE [Tannerella sp.]|jgi:molecular chaperone GrpE|nr:nucleotide exchange factor GrpE [Tannerella sp.]
MKARKEQDPEEEDATKLQNDTVNMSDDVAETDNVADETLAEEDTEDIVVKYSKLNDSYLRLMAEFDNYRKRTLREKADLIKSGGEAALTGLLPVIDDFERALDNIRHTEDMTAIVQGIDLIYNKFMAYLSHQGVKAIEAVGQSFDTEHFEAIAAIPAPEEAMKGKVLECIQTGYTLYDKVIRHAKVVVGE